MITKQVYRTWIGKRLQHYRLKGDLYQSQVACDLGLLEPTYQAYEGGRAEPSIYTIQLFCKNFKIGVEEFLTGSPIDQDPPDEQTIRVF